MPLTEIQKLALTSLKQDVDRSQVPVGSHQVAPFTVVVSGTLKVCNDTERVPTTSLPMTTIIAFAMKRMGFQRDEFIKVVGEVAEKCLRMTKQEQEDLMVEMGLSQFEAAFKAKMRQLPKVPVKGSVSAALFVEPVVTSANVIVD